MLRHELILYDGVVGQVVGGHEGFSRGIKRQLPVVILPFQVVPECKKNLSLMQAKISELWKVHHQAGPILLAQYWRINLQEASLQAAMQGDIILTGGKASLDLLENVLLETMNQKLPDDFQQAKLFLNKDLLMRLLRNEREMIHPLAPFMEGSIRNQWKLLHVGVMWNVQPQIVNTVFDDFIELLVIVTMPMKLLWVGTIKRQTCYGDWDGEGHTLQENLFRTSFGQKVHQRYRRVPRLMKTSWSLSCCDVY